MKRYGFMFLIAATLFSALIAQSAAAQPLWAPSHRTGPSVMHVTQDAWDGYDQYDGSFWMVESDRWTRAEVAAFTSDPLLAGGRDKGFRGVYEFRRITSKDNGMDKEGADANERWDGVWGRNTCAWFIICLGNIVQTVETEYVTSLPHPDNHGTEEFDGWFSRINGVSPNFPWLYPPSYAFDRCFLTEKFAGGGNKACDEEYEVQFNPYELVPLRSYTTAIRFRVDRSDGRLPTRWVTKFEIEEIQDFFIYKNHYPCETDYGSWQIDFEGPSGFDQLEREVFGGCVDYDSDGIVDAAPGAAPDNCPKVANADQSDQDADGLGDACDGAPKVHAADLDADGIVGGDTCPQVANPDQLDTDVDGLGDACDPDDDNDGVPDLQDAFPKDATESVDADSDGIGDNLDPDDDNDCYPDTLETAQGSDPMNPFSKPADWNHNCTPDTEDPPPPPPPVDPDDDADGYPNSQDAFPADPAEWSDADADSLGDNADTDDDNDCYADSIETALGSDPRNPLSRPADNDHDCSPDASDADDDNDSVADTSDAFPLDPSEWLDTDNDGIGNNADNDDDNDLMPDAWEIAHSLNPLVDDADSDADQDGVANLSEYFGDTDPRDWCSPPQVGICYEFTGDVGGQCKGATGVQCVPMNQWSPSMLIDTDGRAGGCVQRFKIISECPVDLQLCVEFAGDSGGADMGQCQNAGTHCAAVNQWTDPITLDMDGRGGWCTQQFFVLGEGTPFTFFLDFTGDDGADAGGQCKAIGQSKAFSEYGTGTDVIGLDTDDRAGGCWEKIMIRRGTWSISAF